MLNLSYISQIVVLPFVVIGKKDLKEEAMIIPYIAVFLGPSIAARIPPGT